MSSLSKMAAMAAGITVLCSAASVIAKEYPDRPIQLIVPFAPGGAPDVLARHLAHSLEGRMGETVIVENRLGAGGNIAYEAVARSKPDGYTLLFASTGIATNASLYKNLPYDTLKDFAPITLVATSPHVLVSQSSLPATSLKELIELGKSKPGELSFGSAGVGTIPHLAGAMFSDMTDVELLHVPYKGLTLARNDLMGGSIQLIFSDIPSALGPIGAGQLRAFGVTGAHRSPSLPNVPTLAEAGVPGYAMEAWFGILAPAGTPKPIVERLNTELRAALSDPELKQKMLAMGQVLIGDSPQEFTDFLQSQVQTMGDVVRASGLQVN